MTQVPILCIPRSIYSDALQTEQEQAGESFDSTQERITYHFPTRLPAGSKANLKVGFSGKLTGSMTGYYKSTYEADGKQKAYALTQFEVCLPLTATLADL